VPWFKIDDAFHCHPKVMDAGTPAIGLYVRCGSWAAQQVTDGVVPKKVARGYGTARMARALVDAGLWHETGHDCESCPETDANSYVIHQYLERNPSRVETDLARDAKTKRQQKWREGKKKPQVIEEAAPDVDASTPRQGDAAPAPARPAPVTPYGSNRAAARTPASSSGAPDALAELKRGIADAGLQGIAWDLREAAWEYTRQAMERVGVPAMVAFALNSSRLKGAPASATAWVQGWRSLEAGPPPGAAVVPIAAAPSMRPSTTDQRVAEGMALAARLRAQEAAQ
jgi:hypothetical protein